MEDKKRYKYTYLMRDGNQCKIGTSVDPEKRVCQLKTARPHIRLVCYGRKASESGMHKRFKDYHTGGEWFKLPEKEFQAAIRLIASDRQLTSIRNKQARRKRRGERRREKKKQKKELRQREQRGYENFVILSGPYEGTRLVDMVSEEQIEYIRLCLDKWSNKNFTYRAFEWWIEKYSEILRVQRVMNKKS
jgi:hypothetical protein